MCLDLIFTPPADIKGKTCDNSGFSVEWSFNTHDRLKTTLILCIQYKTCANATFYRKQTDTTLTYNKRNEI